MGVSEERLKAQLREWLELSLNDKVPPALLLLSRTLYFTEEASFTDRLKTIMTVLPPGIAEEVKLKLADLSGIQFFHSSLLSFENTAYHHPSHPLRCLYHYRSYSYSSNLVICPFSPFRSFVLSPFRSFSRYPLLTNYCSSD